MTRGPQWGPPPAEGVRPYTFRQVSRPKQIETPATTTPQPTADGDTLTPQERADDAAWQARTDASHARIQALAASTAVDHLEQVPMEDLLGMAGQTPGLPDPKVEARRTALAQSAAVKYLDQLPIEDLELLAPRPGTYPPDRPSAKPARTPRPRSRPTRRRAAAVEPYAVKAGRYQSPKAQAQQRSEAAGL